MSIRRSPFVVAAILSLVVAGLLAVVSPATAHTSSIPSRAADVGVLDLGVGPGGREFYCPAATVWRVCTSPPGAPYQPFYAAVSGDDLARIDIQITNHANGGQYCQLYVDHIGLYDPRFIPQGYSGRTWMGGIPRWTHNFNVRCVRAGSSGDAGIGGRVYAN